MKNKNLVFLLLLLVFAQSSFSQNGTKFQQFVDRVNSLPTNLKTAVVDSFMTTVSSFPYTENDTIVDFIYRGNATSAAFTGEVNNWTPAPMQNLAGTDFWYLTKTYESDARFDYKFVINGSSTWILDPRNPYTIMGLSLNSELRMPKYVPSTEIVYNANIPHGQIITTSISSKYLGNSRTVKIYLPPSYSSSPNESFSLAIFHDGLEFLSIALANNTLDNLIYDKKIKPVIGVFIPPVDRYNEYVGSKTNLYVSFISEEIIAQLSTQYRILSDPQNVATIGISNGADISQYLALKLSNKIGNVGSMSAAGNWHTTEYLNSPKLNLKFYVDAGTYDLNGFLTNNKQFVSSVLVKKAYTYAFNIYHEGHSWGSWRAHLHNALEMFFPYDGLQNALENSSASNQSSTLFQNTPNPFNNSTDLRYVVDHDSRVKITIFNSLGIEVTTLVDDFQIQGTYDVKFNTQSLAGGLYFATICVDNVRVNTIKMLSLK